MSNASRDFKWQLADDNFFFFFAHHLKLAIHNLFFHLKLDSESHHIDKWQHCIKHIKCIMQKLTRQEAKNNLVAIRFDKGWTYFCLQFYFEISIYRVNFSLVTREIHSKRPTALSVAWRASSWWFDYATSSTSNSKLFTNDNKKIVFTFIVVSLNDPRSVFIMSCTKKK